MTTALNTPPPGAPRPQHDLPMPPLIQRPQTPILAGLALCLLLAIAQIALGDYQLGVGNQAIQIAFLKHYANPDLYPTDPMVTQTLSHYPTYFFRLLAPFLHVTTVETLYLILHILTGFLTLSAIYLLGRGIHRSHAAALAGVLLLAAGHHTALAGDTLYSQGFTHTYAALPLAIAALALAYRARWVTAFAITGLLFNIHALTAAYTLLMLSAALLADVRRMKPREWLVRTFLSGTTFFAIAAPTLALLLSNRETYDDQWLALMRIRSADHSFPSAWWSVADGDIPRFLLIFALFVLSFSFMSRHPNPARSEPDRITLLMTLAVGILFCVGYLFTEIYPLPTIIRLQPFRASRLLMVLMLVNIASAAVGSLRAAFATAAPRPIRIAQAFSAILILAALAIPSFLPLLPLTVLIATLTALLAGHLSWRQAPIPVLALLITILAFLQIQFPLFTVPENPLQVGPIALRSLAFTALACALILSYPLAIFRARAHRATLISFTFAIGIVLAALLFNRESRIDHSTAPLAGIANWAREKTPTATLFLTPTGMANFRITAERSLVGDWRDGTQLYFSAAFAPKWLERITDLEPGFALSDDGTRLLSRGKPLDSLDDQALLALAHDYHADYILLPTPPKDRPRQLPIAFQDRNFTAYEPQSLAQAPATPAIPPTNLRPGTLPPVTPVSQLPQGVFAPENWRQAEAFMDTTVKQNIEKYRKSDLTLLITDTDGRPVQDPVKIDQTRQAFVFGVSLSFFEPNGISPNGDLKPPPVRPVELEKAPEIFNGSMIAFSSKWQYLEPEKGVQNWSDLDKYVNYAVKNNWTLEFHHLTGTVPDWAYAMGAVDGQRGLFFPTPISAVQTEFNRHCLDTVDRYHDRITYFQVSNEKYMMQYVPTVFKLLKAKYPDTKFGLSDCVKFWDGQGTLGRMGDTDMYKGADAVDWLIEQGIHPDFFSVHGHHPIGLWADPRDMYEVFDYFKQRNVRVHISEEYLQLNGSIYGPLRQGSWTTALQAEYLARYLTVAFSHPSVDMVNLWGLSPNGWGASDSGLIDAAGKTRPAWDTLKKLITETWQTHLTAKPFLDGTLNTRAFHGDYQISITLPTGKTATTTFSLPSQSPATTLHLRLDRNAGTLEVLQ